VKKVLITFAIAPLSWFLYGWAVSLMWAWFVVPVFALPELSIWQAAGLSMLVKLTTFEITGKEATTDSEYWARFVASLVFPMLMVASSWVIKTFLL
jgi:hypothetical protein